MCELSIYLSGSSGWKGIENDSFGPLHVTEREKKKEGSVGEVGEMKQGPTRQQCSCS